jgi:hypothetical protein
VRTFEEVSADARDRAAFSNGTEGYGWMAAWCDRCVHDRSMRVEGVEPSDPSGLIGCPIIAVTMESKTPVEFLDGPRDECGLYSIAEQYHCIEFRDEDDDGPDPEPKPIPDPPDQLLLLPREPYEAVRMLTSEPSLMDVPR